MSNNNLRFYDWQPYRTAGWCGRCAACAAVLRHPSAECGCPMGHVRRSRCPQTSAFTPMPTVARTGDAPSTKSCLHALGLRLSHAAYYGADLLLMPRLDLSDVLLEAVVMVSRAHRPAGLPAPADIDDAALTYHQALAIVLSKLQHLVGTGDFAPSTVKRMSGLMQSLCEFMSASDCGPFVANASADYLARWVDARLAGRRQYGQEAAATTRRLRRSAARMFFLVLRGLGLSTGDPTRDITVPAADGCPARALEDEELLLLRLACDGGSVHDLPPVQLALAEAGGTPAEIACVRIVDWDTQTQRVHLHGRAGRLPRWVPVSSWGAKVIDARVAHLSSEGAPVERRIAYTGEQRAGQPSPGSAVGMGLSSLLSATGLSREPGVRPASIALALGRRLWEQNQPDIGVVARALGYSSADTVARAIGADLRNQAPGDDAAIRAAHLAMPETGVRVFQVGKQARRAALSRASRAARETAAPSAASGATVGIAQPTPTRHGSVVWQAGR